MVKRFKKNISGKFSLVGGVSLTILFLVGLFTIGPKIARALSNVADTFSDSSKIDGSTSSNYVVANGQLRMNYNTGFDGAGTVSGNKNLNTESIVGKSTADGVNYSVSALGTNTITTSTTPTGMATPDEVILINLQGDNTNFGNVGKYEFLHVLSVSGSVLTLTTNIANIYGATNSNSTLTGQKIMVQRVPNYTNVTINGGGTVTASAWDGTKGGVLAFRVYGTLTNNGSITMAGNGFPGGPINLRNGGNGGASVCGLGGGVGQAGAAGGGGGTGAGGNNGICGGGGGTNGAATSGASQGGAGGGGGKGAGAGYGTAGNGAVNGTTNASGNGASGGNGSTDSGGGGGTYGAPDLTQLFLGSGGGAGNSSVMKESGLYVQGCNKAYISHEQPGGAGGAGGGIVFVQGNTLTLGGGTITSNGNNGGDSYQADSCGQHGGGGGSGGAIYLWGNSSSVTLGSGTSATGGTGGSFGPAYAAGSGRIAAQGVASGTTNPTYTSTSVTAPSAVVQSTNLLTGQTVNAIVSFVYNLSGKPTGSTATIQFSQNGTTWYKSDGTLNGSDTLTTGANNSISLSSLNWSGANLYYKIAFSGWATPVLDDVTVNYKTHLEPPTIGTGTALSTTSIRWNFTDNSTDETGFKVYDSNNTLKVTCASANISSCDETGLTAGTSYTRKIAAYDANGIGSYSGTVTASTQSVVPLVPTVTSGTTTTLNINPNPGGGADVTDTYAIYIVPGSGGTCTGNDTNGRYLQSNGTLGGAGTGNGGGTEAWQTDSAWATVTATGLNLDSNVYSICVKDKNTGGTQTAFGPAESGNGGYIPISGNYTSTGNTISNKYKDGNNASANPAQYIYGVDNGTGNGANTAVYTVGSGTTTILANDTLVAGSLSIQGTLIINGQIKVGSKLWVVDADSDGYPAKISAIPNDTPVFYGANAPTNGRRKTALSTMPSTPDCNDSPTGTTPNADKVWSPHAQCYVDADNDTYTNGLQANSTCLGAAGNATPTCNQATARSLAGDANAVTTISATTMQDAQKLASGSNDCDDNTAQVYTSGTCYKDADADTYGDLQSATYTCLSAACGSATAGETGAGGAGLVTGTHFSTTHTDCGDGNANAYPGSATCGTTSFTKCEAAGCQAGSYDYNCSTTGVGSKSTGNSFCGTAYTTNCTTSGTYQSRCHGNMNESCGVDNTAPAYNNSVTQTCGQAACHCDSNTNSCCSGSAACNSVSAGTQGCQ